MKFFRTILVALIAGSIVQTAVFAASDAKTATHSPTSGSTHSPTNTEVSDENYAAREDVRQFVKEMSQSHAFDEDALLALFTSAKHRRDIIEKISKPAEKVWTWGRYKKHLVDEARILQGVEFWQAHEDTLARAHTTYGVAPEIVLAILGIETRYGKITGSYPVFEALTTLGFDYPPRSKFFRKELGEFLQLAREEGKDPLALKGSYAGAMGYGQFISSSYRHYAVDFDDDEVRDIWQNPVDAIGSVANYFHRHRWSGEKPTAIKVAVATDHQLKFDTSIELKSTVGKLVAQGMVVTPEQMNGLDASDRAKLFRVELLDGSYEYWLALGDFYVITRYNRSHLYALAVHHIANQIKAQRGQE